MTSLLIGLAACEEGQMPAFLQKAPEAEAPASQDAPARRGVETEVEAPEVFSANETGLWDGRPSLGGVWVAHPDVTDPERVIIRTADNSKSVIGALFRRERNNPGPALQVSSDAAEALGLLAGQPTALEVVALRTQEAPLLPELTVSDEAPDTPTEEATAIAATAQSSAPTTASGRIETQTLDSVKTAAAAIAASEALAPSTDATASSSSVPAAKPVAVAAAARAPTPSALTKPFIQIGIFSIQQNADNTAVSLRQQGILPTVKAQESQGKKFWRVIVGPTTSKSERAGLLKKIKAQGFNDAYFVTN